MLNTKIIVTGDPLKGFTFYGTFPTEDAAAQWAGDNRHIHGERFDWWVADLIPVHLVLKGEN